MTYAVVCLAVVLVVALVIVLQMNVLTRWMAAAGLLIALAYPLTKRITYFPQLVLGVAFSWGILMASTASTETIPLEIWILALANFLWITAYDTQYAMVDAEVRQENRCEVDSAVLWNTRKEGGCGPPGRSDDTVHLGRCARRTILVLLSGNAACDRVVRSPIRNDGRSPLPKTGLGPSKPMAGLARGSFLVWRSAGQSACRTTCFRKNK